MRKDWEIKAAKEVISTHYDREADADTFVTYRHYRDLDPDFCNEEILPTGGVTFCVVAEPDSEKLHISVAECSSKDLYNKEVGRHISFGRFYRVGEFTTIAWDRDSSIAENIEESWSFFGIIRDSFDVVITGKYRGVPSM
jgi:hypothetical protein